MVDWALKLSLSVYHVTGLISKLMSSFVLTNNAFTVCLDFDKAILRPILANAYCAVTGFFLNYISRLAPCCILHKLSETRIAHGLFA